MKIILIALVCSVQMGFALSGSIFDPVEGVWTAQTTDYYFTHSWLETWITQYRFVFSTNETCEIETNRRVYDSGGYAEPSSLSLKYVGSYSFSNETLKVNARVPGMHAPTIFNTTFRPSYSGVGRIFVATNRPTALILTGWRDATRSELKPPTLTMDRAVELAKNYVISEKIDVSRYFLASADCYYLRDEKEQTVWRVEWRLLDKAKIAPIIVLVYPDEKAKRHDGMILHPFWKR